MEKVYLQITAGRGPRECAYVVAQLLKVIEDEARSCGVKYSLLETEVSEGPMPKALLSATIGLAGAAALPLVDRWLGTIQWIGISPYRPTHKRKNWFVRVARLPAPVQNQSFSGRIAIETMRASGPGGQNVNKTNTAVRATHIESGLSVTAKESRSQNQNRKSAQRKLQALFEENFQVHRKQEESKKWAEHQQVERGNSRRIFHGPDFTE